MTQILTSNLDTFLTQNQTINGLGLDINLLKFELSLDSKPDHIKRSQTCLHLDLVLTQKPKLFGLGLDLNVAHIWTCFRLKTLQHLNSVLTQTWPQSCLSVDSVLTLNVTTYGPGLDSKLDHVWTPSSLKLV